MNLGCYLIPERMNQRSFESTKKYFVQEGVCVELRGTVRSRYDAVVDDTKNSSFVVFPFLRRSKPRTTIGWRQKGGIP